MNAKAKGSRNERRSKDVLESCGYQCTKAAGSLGAWDLIGLSAKDVVLCQVKTRDWPYLHEMQILKDFPAPPNARKLVHRWRDRQKFPDVKEL